MTVKKSTLIPIIVLTAVLAALTACVFIGGGEVAYAADGITITKQPSPIYTFYGDGASYLSVEAEYADVQNLQYKWQYLAEGKEDTDENWINKGSERVYGVKIPADSGKYRCVVYDGTDETVSARTETVTVKVNKAAIDVVIDDVSSFYGEEENDLTYRFNTDVSDEERAKITINPLKRINADNKNAGRYEISDDGYKSDFYTVKFVKGLYTIKKRPLKINVAQLSSVYGDPIKKTLCEIGEGTLADGDTLEDLKIELTEIPDGANAGKYPVTGTYNNSNYEVTFRPASYTVTPKLVEARLVGTTDLVYSGEAPKISCEIIGERPENLTATVTFDKAVRNAGEYKAYIRLSDLNYATLTSEISFVIKKKPLTIGVDDIVATEGAEYAAEYFYDGFVNGETADDLASPPVLSSTPTTPGVYTVRPTGANSGNYDITYLSATVQINVTEAECEDGVFTGSFQPNTVIDLSDDGAEILDEHFKRVDRLRVYNVKIPSDGVYGEYTAKLKGVQKFIPVCLRACIIDEDGNKVVLKDYGYDEDGDFVFTADGTGVLVIYYNLTIPIAVVAVLLVLILIIVVKKSRDLKRYESAYVKHYVAKQYAADMVNRNKENY